MAIQRRNDENVNILGADFQRRHEGGFAWRTACSTILALPGLRGFWPMSAFESGGNAFDQSGNGRTLTYNGNPRYDFDGLAPYIRLDGTGDYLSRADEAGLDILGTETYVAAGHQGITVGGWFLPEDAASDDTLLSKWGAAGQRSWVLQAAGTVAAPVADPVRFYISDDGTNASGATSTSGFVANEWQFMAGRFNDALTGLELAVWLNDEMTSAATARNAIFNSNASFCVGAEIGGPANLLTGRASMCFLCAVALHDSTVWSIYQQTRALFRD